MVTGSMDKKARMWDIATGTVIRTFSGHTNLVYSVAYSLDGTKILTGSDDSTGEPGTDRIRLTSSTRLCQGSLSW